MGSDYLLVLGVILLCSPKTVLLGILSIAGACIYKQKKPKKRRKLDQFNR